MSASLISYEEERELQKLLQGHKTFGLQPELSQSELYVQGPSPSAHGFEEEHLDIWSHFCLQEHLKMGSQISTALGSSMIICQQISHLFLSYSETEF